MTNDELGVWIFVGILMLIIGSTLTAMLLVSYDWKRYSTTKKAFIVIRTIIGAFLAILGLATIIRCIYLFNFFPWLYNTFKEFWQAKN